MKTIFFSYCVRQWDNLKAEIRISKSLDIFKNLIVSDNLLYSVYDPLGVTLLSRLRLEFSLLNENKFRHGFKDTLNPLCACGAEVETTEHLLLHYQLCFTHRSELFDKIVKVDQQTLNLNAKDEVHVLFYGSQRNNSENSNQNIINFVIKYLQTTGRFDKSIFNRNQ